MNILCCGFFPALQRTIETKSFRPGEVNRAVRVSVSASGKATNTARVLSRLGADATMLSFAGGTNGDTVRRLLEPEDFNCRWVETKAETRICQTLLCGETGSCTELVEESPPLSAAEWKSFVKTFAQIESGFDRIVFCGNLPPHAPQEIYGELLSKTDGNKVLIDTSGPPLLAAFEHRPALVKINAEELRRTIQIDDRQYGLDRQARELIARGAGAAGITQGKDAAMLVTPDHVFRYTIPQVKALNPIGSGDAVSAGTVFALTKGSTLPEAFAFGLACGTANAMNRAPGHIEFDQLAELTPKISTTNEHE